MRAIDKAQDKILQDVINKNCPSDYGIETEQSLKCYTDYEDCEMLVKNGTCLACWESEVVRSV